MRLRAIRYLIFLLAFYLPMTTHRFAAALDLGNKAPDFELESTSGGKFKLSDLKGKNVLLNFYILDFNPACIKGLQASASNNYSLFKSENTEVAGISTNITFSQKAFVDIAKINLPLLSDRNGKVMREYGVYDESRRLAKRAYVIIDKDGVVRYINIRPTYTEKDLLPTEELLTEVKKVNKR